MKKAFLCNFTCNGTVGEERIIRSKERSASLYLGSMTHQYGVPMKESLLCNVLVFLADTPKSAENRN